MTEVSKVRYCFALVAFLGSLASGELRIRDYHGEVNVTRVRLDSTAEPVTYHMDVDGDGRRDTIVLTTGQVGYELRWKANEEVVLIADIEPDGDENIVEFAAAYVISPYKPVMVVKISCGIHEAFTIRIVDLLRTARGLRAEVLLDGDAGWLNSQTTVVKPNFIESRHFRGWPVVRYLWNGEEFVKQNLDEPTGGHRRHRR